jgi:hypothetical protein
MKIKHRMKNIKSKFAYYSPHPKDQILSSLRRFEDLIIGKI